MAETEPLGQHLKTAQWTSFELKTLPPSANKLFANGPHGRHKTPFYKNWLESSGWEIKAQKPDCVKGAYSLKIRVGKTGKRRDLDNCIKALSDLAVNLGLVEDDSLCQKLEAEWMPTPGTHVMIISMKEVA